MMPEEGRDSFFPDSAKLWVSACSLWCLLLFVTPLESNQVWGAVFLDEHFESLARWHVQPFGDKPRSNYSAVLNEGHRCLLMESNNSASLLVLNQEFNVYKYPKLSWRWKVSNVYHKGDSSSRDGDDYPARIYIMFPYDSDHISLVESIKYRVALASYGPPVPGSSINYIWDNRASNATVIPNAFTDQVQMIPVSAGPSLVNTWQTYTVDIVSDYRRAFGFDPPPIASLAVMNDSDNTGESSKSWISFVRIFNSQ